MSERRKIAGTKKSPGIGTGTDGAIEVQVIVYASAKTGLEIINNKPLNIYWRMCRFLALLFSDTATT